MMFTILAFQQKQVHMFFSLPFRGPIFHTKVPCIGIVVKYIHTKKWILAFNLRYLLRLDWEIYPGHVQQIFIFPVRTHLVSVDFARVQRSQYRPQETLAIRV